MIEKYNNHITIGILRKKSSPIRIMFCTKDIPDMWLIDRISYREKSGTITDDVMFLNKDFREELLYWYDKGYKGSIRTRFTFPGEIILLKKDWKGARTRFK